MHNLQRAIMPRILQVALLVASLQLALSREMNAIEGFDWSAIKYVYAFGDSYSFVQGTSGFPNFR